MSYVQDKLIMMLMLLFGPPIVFCAWMSTHPSTVFWVGLNGFWGAFVSLIWVLLGHHTLASGWLNKRTVTVLVFVIPSFVLLYVAKEHKMVALQTYDMLLAQDCNSFAKKAHLQQAWENALQLHSACVDYQVNVTGAPREDVETMTQVSRCPGYVKSYRLWAKEWDYLQKLEEREDCSGWCSVHAPLWTVSPRDSRQSWMPRESCTQVAASILKAKVFRTSEQVIAYCLVVIALLGILIGFMEL